MHPILARGARLALYQAVWALAGILLAGLLRSTGGFDWTQSLAVAIPLTVTYGFFCLSAWYVSRSMPLAATGPLRLTATALTAACISSAAWLLLSRLWIEVLARRGTRALVFRGDDGLDELTTTTTSAVWVVRDGEVIAERVDPTALGLPLSPPGALRGGVPEVNAEVVRRLVAGDRGPVRDAVLLNAAAALAAFDERGARLHDALGHGLQQAAAAVDDGRAAAKLDEWVRVSRAARSATGT